ncbi:MAG TPA: hypothetical protein DCS29_02665 [Candidatus Magasanikbacteria bacterium]|nr:MAG: hypothetical protein A2479_00170 [Candidatus Magasanikbacteria bacterium RIFOXYC2_FULL_39_8]HAT03658.1 hypothetical protein [Candidatus Magasanikbacteria bacterium]
MEASRHKRYIRHFLSFPFIYGLLLPLVLLDIVVEIYHRVCFPLYGLPYIRRGQYIRIDRHKLSYLNLIEKMNCVYCGYGNGLAHYLTEIAAQTEKYWCGIRHKDIVGFIPPKHHKDFLPYGDEGAFREFMNK